jgi:hypothetical protein
MLVFLLFLLRFLLIAIGDSALKTLRKPASTRPKAILCPKQKSKWLNIEKNSVTD